MDRSWLKILVDLVIRRTRFALEGDITLFFFRVSYCPGINRNTVCSWASGILWNVVSRHFKEGNGRPCIGKGSLTRVYEYEKRIYDVGDDYDYDRKKEGKKERDKELLDGTYSGAAADGSDEVIGTRTRPLSGLTGGELTFNRRTRR